MNKLRLLIITIIAVSVALNVYLLVHVFLLSSELRDSKESFQIQQRDEKVLNFMKLFVNIILQGDSVVSFDDRLNLENAVRAINDQEIFDEWKEFTESSSSEKTQQIVGNLFNLLVEKLQNPKNND
jgi:hypothetical protein